MTLTIRFAIRTLFLVGGLSSSLFAARCTEQPLRFFIYPVTTLQDGTTTVPSAIKGDGNWYTDGGGMVARINICSETYDATLTLSTKRKLTVTFPAPIAGSYVDSPIPAGSYSVSGFINVRNLLCSGCANPHNTFTTHIGTQLPSLIGNKTFYLRFMPLAVDAPDLHIDPTVLPEENFPYTASPGVVVPQPYNCNTGGTVKPSWIVRGNTPNAAVNPQLQVGTAHDYSTNPPRRAGQYSMPFEIRIEALQCFTY